jgi:Fe-S cluster biogenesis protein NfuA
MALNKIDLEEKARTVLLELRPFFEADGGNIEFVEITDEGILKVELIGACSDCSMSMMTLKAGVEEAIKKIAPEIVKVEAINLETV